MNTLFKGTVLVLGLILLYLSFAFFGMTAQAQGDCDYDENGRRGCHTPIRTEYPGTQEPTQEQPAPSGTPEPTDEHGIRPTLLPGETQIPEPTREFQLPDGFGLNPGDFTQLGSYSDANGSFDAHLILRYQCGIFVEVNGQSSVVPLSIQPPTSGGHQLIGTYGPILLYALQADDSLEPGQFMIQLVPVVTGSGGLIITIDESQLPCTIESRTIAP